MPSSVLARKAEESLSIWWTAWWCLVRPPAVLHLQETFWTGEGGMWMMRWISHTVKTESVDTRLATDLSVFAVHTTTWANSHVPPQKLLKPKQIPHSRSYSLYPQLFHYTLSTVFTTPPTAAGCKLWQAITLTAKGRRKWRSMTVRSTSSISTAFISLAAPNHPTTSIKGMLSESSMPISIVDSDHLNHRLKTQQNSLALAPFDPCSAIIIWPIIMWRLELDPTCSVNDTLYFASHFQISF